MAHVLPFLSLGLVLTSAASACADPRAAEQKTLDGFAAANKTCRAWSDGCVVCARRGEAAYACSTPGIACQPTSLACRESVPGPEAAH